MSAFAPLGLRPELLAALDQLGYAEATPIQAAALPALLAGEDVIGQAQTGSGKTAAFGLAILNDLAPEQTAPQALVICPTRELAEQVTDALRRLAAQLPNTRILAITGGRPQRAQRRSLARGVHVVVGTPGRLGAHLRRGDLDLYALRRLVLDEADRMLDMGFIDQVAELARACPPDRQTMLFSATFPEAISALSDQALRAPRRISVAARVDPAQLEQRVYEVERGGRIQRLVDLLAAHRPSRSLVFCETRGDCDRIAAALSERGARALALHGEMEQRDRDDALIQFSNQSASALVATDVAARGIDIPSLPMVLVAELSPEPERHVHRIGRTARAGEAGLALSLVSGPRELARLERIEAFMGQPIARGEPPPPGDRLDALAPPNRTLLILAGRRDKLRKGDVLGALVKDGGVPPEAIGQIDLRQTTCAVAVARSHARRALRYVQGGRIKRRRVRARLLG